MRSYSSITLPLFFLREYIGQFSEMSVMRLSNEY